MDTEDMVKEILLMSDFDAIDRLRCTSIELNIIINKVLNNAYFCKEYLEIHSITSEKIRNWKIILKDLMKLSRAQQYHIFKDHVVISSKYLHLHLQDILLANAYELSEVMLENKAFNEKAEGILNIIIGANNINLAESLIKYLDFCRDDIDCLECGNINPEILRIAVKRFGTLLDQNAKNWLMCLYRQSGNQAAVDVMLENN